MKKVMIMITCILFLGCATTITTRKITQNTDIKLGKKEVMDAITLVLFNNGFDVAMMNENYGLINTNYRIVNSGTDTALSVLNIVASSLSHNPSSYSIYSRELMLTFQITNEGYIVIPKVKKIENSSSAFGHSSQDNIEYPVENSAEGKLTDKIITEINKMLGIENSFMWTEKEISVSESEQNP